MCFPLFTIVNLCLSRMSTFGAIDGCDWLTRAIIGADLCQNKERERERY